MNKFFLLFCFGFVFVSLNAQTGFKWSDDGNGYYQIEEGNLVLYQLPGMDKSVVIDKVHLKDGDKPLKIQSYQHSYDKASILIFTNSVKVWRYETKGDYFIYSIASRQLQKIGSDFPPSSLMFAEFSPDGKKVAYVHANNIYAEEIATKKVEQLTSDGTRKLINGTFDWAYEEEFFCRDGFRWSPDSRAIAFWQIDARGTKDYLMVNNTDSIYPTAIPVEYPVAGESPSPFKIGVLELEPKELKWMNIPYDQSLGSYAPRMEWVNANQLVVQHLDRKQQHSALLLTDVKTGVATSLYKEYDSAWIDIMPSWDQDYANGGWDWLNGGREFLWASEKDGWRHIYRLSVNGGKETLITRGNFDVMDIVRVDEKGNYLYFMASPENATQLYLYRSRLDGKGLPERVTPRDQPGTHRYEIAPGAKYAKHSFSNHYINPAEEWITLKDHKTIGMGESVAGKIASAGSGDKRIEFIKIRTAEAVEMDAWVAKPTNFDPAKKYPVVFYVYTEPWGQTVKDEYGAGRNFLYNGDMATDGYIYVSLDNRGTPVPKGRAWRKIAYRKIGQVNIRDQALAAREILKWTYIDSSRVAVWGWSGGGSATLNLMFQYPEIYKTGISIAAVGNQLTYDNIYQERYMGLPQENRQDFVKGSPITYAKNLRGNLLYIHGTGDDNVHYNNAEMLFNELIRHNKQFRMMSYPNRTHSISEGEGTYLHLSTLYTNFLRQYCEPGGK
ncbi:DPP IV N-terminal domain-containing protein [Flavihumibacter sp. ZG627]|uniref:S9 family peptidase n=1 Tax=Flavihumibacter sp. ZG627 TaxID=1463156 RepID=UPI00057D1BF4|nr:DPP IV N-terminal domain-containing protein [Flavihumibacter sp. ZG627]KIC90261.1 peptidase S9 [Flavihumibacter sp. ZG627]